MKAEREAWPRNLTAEQKLACLSARMPIEFMSSTPTTQEQDQIANHMRICLSVDESFHRMISLNPSEPILSDGAAIVMNNNAVAFHAPAALSHILTGFSINQGDRGELVAMLAYTIARDSVVHHSTTTSMDGIFGVVPFLRALIRKPKQETQLFRDVLEAKPAVFRVGTDKNATLESAFKDINMYFNHFIKRQEQDHFDEEAMRGLLARSAAIVGAHRQSTFDFLFPTARGRRTVVAKTTTGLILAQVKFNTKYSDTIDTTLFDGMNPFRMGFIDENETLETPIIRIVFAMAAKKPSVQYVTTQKPGKFTSYDIWVSGLRHEMYGVIDEADQSTWTTLLSASTRKDWETAYKHPDHNTVTLLTSMNPMVASGEGFCAFQKKQPQARVP